MIKIRYKKLQSGKYSASLAIYARDANGAPKRNYDFLGIYVSKDYSKIKRIAEIDKEKIGLAKAVKAKREIEVINSTHRFNHKKKFIKTDEFEVIGKLNALKQDYNMDCSLKQLKCKFRPNCVKSH